MGVRQDLVLTRDKPTSETSADTLLPGLRRSSLVFMAVLIPLTGNSELGILGKVPCSCIFIL